jgi:hypothetical protein
LQHNLRTFFGSQEKGTDQTVNKHEILIIPRLGWVLVSLNIPESKIVKINRRFADNSSSHSERTRYGKGLDPLSTHTYILARGATLTSDPVPELEHVGLVDAELLHLGRISRERSKVLRHMRLLVARKKLPV